MNLSRKFALLAAALVLVAGCKTSANAAAKKADEPKPAVKAAEPVKQAEAPKVEAPKTEVKAAEPNAAPDAKEAEAKKLEKISYAIGFNTGNSFKTNSIEVNMDAFIKGIKNGLAGDNSVMTEDEMRATLTAFSQELRAKMVERQKVQGEDNKKKGEEFLKANATKEGVKTTTSGLQYKVITEGTGAMPKATDTVKVHYKGTLIDGKEFDSSYKRGEPVEFPVGGVIAGWTEALQLMKVGSKYQLFIPAGLAYAENAPPSIGPNQVLIFEVELLDIVKPEAAPAAATEPKIEVKPAEPAKK